MTHGNLRVNDVPNINIIIGRNDTGKTALLKLLYAITKSLENFSKKKRSDESPSFRKELAEKLSNTFMPRHKRLGELVQKQSNEKLEVEIHFSKEKYQQAINFSFGDRTENTITNGSDNAILSIPEEKDGKIANNALFIPAKEVLSAFNDIRAIRELEYGRGFDDTYLDLIKSLDVPTQSGNLKQEFSAVNRKLEALFEGKIEQTGQRDQPFSFKRGTQQFAMQQTAEGIKKIGILTTLINNRQLNKGTILFMDEPETALHPDAVRKLVEMLVGMSNAGVQVFIATHSYFVIKQITLCAKRDNTDVLCWNLNRDKVEPVQAAFHNLKDGVLPKNTIIDEALAMYEDDLKINLGL